MIDPAIRSRLEQHVIAAQAVRFRTIAGGIFEVAADWARGFSGLRWPSLNVFLPRTSAGLTDDTLADTAAFFGDRKVHYSIELVHDRFPDGPDFLDERRYQAFPPQPAMLLQTLPEHIQPNQEVQIELVQTVPSLTAFNTILHQVFDFPLSDMSKLYPVYHLKNDAIQHYLGFVNEQPVGAGTVICTEGAASIWNLCTIDSYRKHGVAATLLLRLLRSARERQCPLVTLYSTAQAFNLFSRFGFEIYTQRQWFLPPGIDYADE